MSDHAVTLLFSGIVLLGGGGLALGAFALGSAELAYSILGFAGGLLSGGVMPRLSKTAAGE